MSENLCDRCRKPFAGEPRYEMEEELPESEGGGTHSVEVCHECMEKINADEPLALTGQAKEVAKAAIQFARAYVDWTFEDAKSFRLGLLGDIVRERFRDYLKAAEPDLFKLCEDGAKRYRNWPRLVIHTGGKGAQKEG